MTGGFNFVELAEHRIFEPACHKLSEGRKRQGKWEGRMNECTLHTYLTK
jgi:hypothetical protein